MKIFLDTADVDQIRTAYSWGIIDGVTTNPSHVAASGRPFREVVEEICDICPGPVRAEVISTEADGIIEEAHEVSSWAPNIVVKVPVIKEGIKAIARLSQEGIKTNATICFSANQALLAAKAGATYISPFVGRLDAVGHDGMILAEEILEIYRNYDFTTQIIVSAARHPLHVLQAARMGAHVTTMRFDILEQMFHHPLTDAGLEQFLSDWNEAGLTL